MYYVLVQNFFGCAARHDVYVCMCVCMCVCACVYVCFYNCSATVF